MSLLCAYHRNDLAVIASDNRACVQTPHGPQPIPGEFPKFCSAGSLIVGCVGRTDLTACLLSGCERMLAQENIALGEAVELFPALLARMWGQRSLGLSDFADKLHCALIGFDRDVRRMRSYIWLSDDGFVRHESTADPRNCFFSLGAFELTDEAPLEDFSDHIGRNARHLGTPWIASQLRSCIDSLSKQYAAIGPASYFAALDRNGPLHLPDNFPLAPSRIVMPEIPDASPDATAGRFYVGSITTPVQGGADTIGNNDGGAGAQVPTSTNQWVSTFVGGASGNGSATGVASLNEGSPAGGAVITAAGNGGGSTFNPASVVATISNFQNDGYTTIRVLASIPTNTLGLPNVNQAFATVGAHAWTFKGLDNVPAGFTCSAAYFECIIPPVTTPSTLTITFDVSTGGSPYFGTGEIQVALADCQLLLENQ